MSGSCRTFAIAVACALAIGCHAKVNEFYARTFRCEPGDSCGTARDGRPMMCYPAHQLGGRDFCTETCDPTKEPEQYGAYACLSSRARLRICDVTAPLTDPERGCPAGLNCFRTSIIGSSNQGLCMDVPICTTDADCPTDQRRECASTALREIAPASVSTSIMTDHLYCLTPDCQTGGAQCPDGVCLRSVNKTIGTAPDVCVPNCDANFNCPPGFGCARKLYSGVAPQVCIPAVLGYRCERTSDCLAGICTDTGAGFKQCTFPCRTHADCASLSGPSGIFGCYPVKPEGTRACILLDDFTGTECDTDADCYLPGQRCFSYHPLIPGHTKECRYPCSDTMPCAQQAGVPMLCPAGGAGGCYPGYFGMTCSSDDDCVLDYRCLDVPDGDGGTRKMCTSTCDGGCSNHNGYCHDGLCLYGSDTGQPCQVDEQCTASHRCDLADGGMAGRCAP